MVLQYMKVVISGIFTTLKLAAVGGGMKKTDGGGSSGVFTTLKPCCSWGWNEEKGGWRGSGVLPP
jgi:hypothetical protein